MRRYRKKLLYGGLVVFILIILLHPNYNALRTYTFIEKESIINNLHIETAKNFTSSVTSACSYHDIIYNDRTLSENSYLFDSDLSVGQRVWEGGEYAPPDCKPMFSTAIIVPYRDRIEQLRAFLIHLHTFLYHQRIHYRIYVIEQIDLQPFNKGKLLNIGAVAAMRAGYPCLILHDVNLLPLKVSNLYACTVCPRHMSCTINKYRFVLPHLKMFGGAVAIVAKQFKEINGVSNEYKDWSSGNDDMYSRLEARGKNVCRFDPETSYYFMFPHKPSVERHERLDLVKSAKERMQTDGLKSLKYTEVATVLHPLFTHIMVDT